MVRSDIDVKYFDDFTSPDDMQIYKDVKKREMDVSEISDKEGGVGVNNDFVGFTFKNKEFRSVIE